MTSKEDWAFRAKFFQEKVLMIESDIRAMEEKIKNYRRLALIAEKHAGKPAQHVDDEYFVRMNNRM